MVREYVFRGVRGRSPPTYSFTNPSKDKTTQPPTSEYSSPDHGGEGQRRPAVGWKVCPTCPLLLLRKVKEEKKVRTRGLMKPSNGRTGRSVNDFRVVTSHGSCCHPFMSSPIKEKDTKTGMEQDLAAGKDSDPHLLTSPSSFSLVL